jgi:hypothetical protein
MSFGLRILLYYSLKQVASASPLQFQVHHLPMAKTCLTCAYCLKTDSQSPLRCGIQYFQRPPSERKPARLDQYPSVTAIHSCSAWNELAQEFHRQVNGA